MNIHEYQGKQLFKKHGIPVPQGIPVFKPEDAEAAAQKLIDDTKIPVVVVKAQIHAGGRGKAGGVKVVTGGPKAALEVAKEIFGKTLITPQNSPDGTEVKRLYIEQGLDIARELYLGLVIDRAARQIAVMASTEGGVEIEEVAEHSPEKIITEHVDPLLGLAGYQARKIAYALNIAEGSPDPKKTTRQFVQILMRLASLFEDEDCSMCEINPLVVTKSGDVVALDSKINLDDNAEARHPEWGELVDRGEEDPVELKAKEAGLSFVSLDGNIGCLVNGAGLAMATMDIIKHHGGTPANFLDVGGSATKEQVKEAFSMILASPKVKGIFVNIFGGIAKCDLIAEGIVAATKELALTVPLVVRLEGTNVARGKQILKDSGLAIQAADTMADGAKMAVAAVSA